MSHLTSFWRVLIQGKIDIYCSFELSIPLCCRGVKTRWGEYSFSVTDCKCLYSPVLIKDPVLDYRGKCKGENIVCSFSPDYLFICEFGTPYTSLRYRSVQTEIKSVLGSLFKRNQPGNTCRKRLHCSCNDVGVGMAAAGQARCNLPFRRPEVYKVFQPAWPVGVLRESCVPCRALTFVYPFGATLNVMKPAVAVLSTGSICFPPNRPVLAFYQHEVRFTMSQTMCPPATPPKLWLQEYLETHFWFWCICKLPLSRVAPASFPGKLLCRGVGGECIWCSAKMIHLFEWQMGIFSSSSKL